MADHLELAHGSVREADRVHVEVDDPAGVGATGGKQGHGETQVRGESEK